MPETTVDRLMMRSREAMRDSREPSDDDLIGRFYGGDAEAFRALDGRYRRRLLGYFLLLARNFAIAEDLVQETFLKVIKTDAKYQPGSNGFKAWLFRIAGRVCVDHFRRQRPGDAAPIEEDTKKEDPEHGQSHSVVVPSYAPRADEVLLVRQLLTMILKLPTKGDAAAFLLRVYLGLTAKEAAFVLGKNEANAVDQSIARAKKAIQELSPSVAPAFDIASLVLRHAVHEVVEEIKSAANQFLSGEQIQRLLMLLDSSQGEGNNEED